MAVGIVLSFDEGRAGWGACLCKRDDGLVEEGEFDICCHGQVYQGVEEDYGTDVAVPEKAQGPAAGNHHLYGHEEWLVGACLYHMGWEDIDPEKAVDKTAVNHEEDKACDEEGPWVCGESASKSCTHSKNGIEHEGFGNAVANTEYEYSEHIEFAAAISCGMGIDPGIGGDDEE